MEKPDYSRRRLLQLAGSAGLLAGVTRTASAQHEGHDMSKMDMSGMNMEKAAPTPPKPVVRSTTPAASAKPPEPSKKAWDNDSPLPPQ